MNADAIAWPSKDTATGYVQNAGTTMQTVRTVPMDPIAWQVHRGLRVQTALMITPVPKVKHAASLYAFLIWLCIAVVIMTQIGIAITCSLPVLLSVPSV